MTSAKQILVSGAGGGIGRALVDGLAARVDVARVYALHRHPVSSTCSKVVWLEGDLDSQPSLVRAAGLIREQGGLDGIIQASGLLHAPGTLPEKSLQEVSAENLLTLYAANAVGPLMLAKACQDLFRRSERSFLCFLSAQVGSIGDNRLGGWYGYRMAKAALNMAVRTAAVELGRSRSAPLVVAVHPGTTRTALSTPFIQRRRQPVSSAEHSAARILDLIDHLQPEDHGGFLNYDGTPLPW